MVAKYNGLDEFDFNMSGDDPVLDAGDMAGTETLNILNDEPVEVSDQSSKKPDIKVVTGPCPVVIDKSTLVKHRHIPIAYSEVGGVPTYDVHIFGVVYEYKEYAELVSLITSAGDNVEINIHLSSPGGSVNIGSAVGSAILNSKAKVTCIAEGPIYSIAMFIWSCGHFQRIKDGSSFLFHMSSHSDYNNSSLIKRKAEDLITYVRDYLLGISLRKGHLVKSEFDDICEKSIDIVLSTATMRTRLSGLAGYVPEVSIGESNDE